MFPRLLPFSEFAETKADRVLDGCSNIGLIVELALRIGGAPLNHLQHSDLIRIVVTGASDHFACKTEHIARVFCGTFGLAPMRGLASPRFFRLVALQNRFP